MLNEPYDDFCRFARSVSYQLAKMVMIRGIKLVFNDDFTPRVNLPRKNIHTEVPDWRLLFINRDVYANSVRQTANIVFGSQLWCKVLRFVRPDLAQISAFL